MSTLTTLCKTDEVPVNGVIQVNLPEQPPIAVYNLDGEFLATAGYCTHADAALCDGYLENGTIECPWHAARFEVRTGKALNFPATVDLETYRVEVQGDEVMAELKPAEA